MIYYVSELCITADGTNENAVYTRDTEEAAMKLWHQKCAADIDNVGYRNVLLMVTRQDGRQITSVCYVHPVEAADAE